MNWLLVACGGAIGASLRYGAGFLISKPLSLFPWATWSINILGCFLAGIFVFTLRYPIPTTRNTLVFHGGNPRWIYDFFQFWLRNLSTHSPRTLSHCAGLYSFQCYCRCRLFSDWFLYCANDFYQQNNINLCCTSSENLRIKKA